MNKRRSRYQTAFGAALAAQLETRKMSQAALAVATQVSTPYANQVVGGKKLASARWVDLVSAALKLPADEKRRMHIAAARDHGFKVDQ